MTDCGRCHTCGDPLTSDDWCVGCRAFRRYATHGWAAPGADSSVCGDAPRFVPALGRRAS